MTDTYPAKLLLFGEYTIINNSFALAIPHPVYVGKWQYSALNNNSILVKNSQNSLTRIVDYLEALQNDSLLKASIDLKKMKADIKNGLWFDSSIPTGYGLGSSGAVCAAIYQQYCIAPSTELSVLRAELSALESCFHGKSSGIDPLVSYLRSGILIKNKVEVEVLSDFLPNLETGQGAIFLIDTQISRETPPLVLYYLEQAQQDSFVANYIMPTSELVKKSIDSYIASEAYSLLAHVAAISALQYIYMSHFIPSAFKAIWAQGLASESYSLKLCGAGGGGFILGFTQNWENAQALLADYSPSKLFELSMR